MGDITITSFDKIKRTATIVTERGLTRSIAGIDVNLGDDGLKNFIVDVSRSFDIVAVNIGDADADSPLAKSTLKSSDVIEADVVKSVPNDVVV